MDDAQSKLDHRLKLFAIGVVLLALAFVLLPVLFRAPQRARKQNCLANMVAIGLSGRMWANENGDRMPQTLTEMSNEVVSPKVLFCPADPGAQNLRKQMSTWDRFDEQRCSYEIVNPGISETNRDNVFIRCKAHGHLGYVDGSVFDGKRHLSGHEAKFGTPAPGAASKE